MLRNAFKLLENCKYFTNCYQKQMKGTLNKKKQYQCLQNLMAMAGRDAVVDFAKLNPKMTDSELDDIYQNIEKWENGDYKCYRCENLGCSEEQIKACHCCIRKNENGEITNSQFDICNPKRLAELQKIQEAEDKIEDYADEILDGKKILMSDTEVINTFALVSKTNPSKVESIIEEIKKADIPCLQFEKRILKIVQAKEQVEENVDSTFTRIDDKLRDINDRDTTVYVAFYARVSTLHEEQISALENQLKWYNHLLELHPNWVKVAEYVDKGVTGTRADKRKAFQDMLADAHSHKFDLLVTRETSRFSRNILESLQYTRELHDIGVEVYFVNEGIFTGQGDGELRLAIMSAMAQEEARHISERVLAGQAISRKQGVLYGNGNVLGYDLVKGQTSKENTYVVNPEQAETVRLIFDMYLQGMGTKRIANRLIEMGRKKSGGSMKWDSTVVWKVLSNKIYAGFIGYARANM